MTGLSPAVLVAASSGIGALAVTWAVLVATRRYQWVDHPNYRSAHARPMPTAGGLGIIAGYWVGLTAYGISATARMTPVHGGLLAGTVVLAFMVWDDWIRPLGVVEKLVLTVSASGAWLVVHSLPPQVDFPGWSLARPGWMVAVLCVLWIVAMCNATNFMDGIDGIVGGHTVLVAAASSLMLWHLEGPWEIALALAAASGGFLVLNRPPARIFMGDVGSHFIGFVLAVGGLAGMEHGLPLWLYAALNGSFFYDTGYTLARRGLRGDNLVQAHQKHLYQRLVTLGWSPAGVDALVLLVDAVLAAGGCLWIFGNRTWGLAGLAFGLLLLIAGTLYVESQDDVFR